VISVAARNAIRVVAIHQPNFFPWLGYFDKIRRADVFVVLDNVQFQKTGGTWSNRVMLNVGGKAQWVTAPVVRTYHGVRAISEIEFDQSIPWRDRIVKTIEFNYRRAAAFDCTFPHLLPLLTATSTKMLAHNLAAIHGLTSLLGLDARKLVLASSLGADGHSTELLINITRAVGGSAYLAGSGAAGYQQDELFERAGLELRHQRFEHPVYPQRNAAEFIPGLSVIDALLNVGVEATRRLLDPSAVKSTSP
jgi:hypothetical protein